MRAYRVKNKMRTPCRGVVGGVREIPPERKGNVKRKLTAAVMRRTGRTVYAINTTPAITRASTVYDNANVTTPGLIRVLIVVLIFLITLIINS